MYYVVLIVPSVLCLTVCIVYNRQCLLDTLCQCGTLCCRLSAPQGSSHLYFWSSSLLRSFARRLRLPLQHPQVLGGHLANILLRRYQLQRDDRRPDSVERKRNLHQRLHHLALPGANTINHFECFIKLDRFPKHETLFYLEKRSSL